MTQGERHSITLYTPGKLDRLTAQDWDTLAKACFPIYLYEPLPARMRRLTTPAHVMSLTPESERVQATLANGRADQPHYHHRSYAALISHHMENDEHLWTSIPVPSIADPNNGNLLKPKTLLDCCHCAQEFLDERDLNDGYDKGTLYLMSVYGHRTRMLTQFQYLQAAAERNDRHCFLWTMVNMLRLVFCMASEAGLETVLSAAYSLKHGPCDSTCQLRKRIRETIRNVYKIL